MSTDEQFDRVIAAMAHYNRFPPLTPEQLDRQRQEAHKRDPRHIKALAKRKKRKRGGPK